MTMQQAPQPGDDVVLCLGAKTKTVWQAVLGREDLRSFLIETPEDPGWHKMTAIADPAWAFAARRLREVLTELRQATFRRLHVFAMGPYGLGALLSGELEYHFGRDREIHIYQFDNATRAWVDWGLLGHPLPPAGEQPLLRFELPQDAAATQVVVAINTTHPIQRAEVDPALADLPKPLWLEIEGPKQVSGPAQAAQAAQVAAELDVLLRTTLPARYPAAEFHVFYGGPLAAFVLATAKLHLAARRLTIYERIGPGGAWRYWAALRLPERRLCFGDGVIFLAVIDEWFSTKGGISTFNRLLCRGLGKLDYRVLCLVTDKFSKAEEDDAAQSGVRLLLGAPAESPDVLLGHDHISGAQVLKLKQERYPRSRAVLLIHTGPDDIEWEKDAPDEQRSHNAQSKGSAQARLARDADLVFGVGPRLTDQIHDALRQRVWRRDHVHELRPWLLPVGSAAQEPPTIGYCLLVGRPEHVRLKGIDLAIKAMERLPNPPPLYLRGASPGTAAELQAKLPTRLRTKLRIQTFDPDEENNSNAFRGAMVVLMPSRSEGFGLVGLEAISYQVPVLVSDESGLGKMLGERKTEAAMGALVTVSGGDRGAIAAWQKAIEQKLNRRDAAFKEAQQLHQELNDVLSAEKILPLFVSRCLAPAAG